MAVSRLRKQDPGAARPPFSSSILIPRIERRRASLRSSPGTSGRMFEGAKSGPLRYRRTCMSGLGLLSAAPGSHEALGKALEKELAGNDLRAASARFDNAEGRNRTAFPPSPARA